MIPPEPPRGAGSRAALALHLAAAGPDSAETNLRPNTLVG